MSEKNKCNYHPVTAPDGVVYDNIVEMCKAYGCYDRRKTVEWRMSHGYTVEEALSDKYLQHRGGVKDHEGNSFGSYREMAEYWNVSYSRLINRLCSGYPIKDALDPKYVRWNSFTIGGKYYKSLKAYARDSGLVEHYSRLKSRLKWVRKNFPDMDTAEAVQLAAKHIDTEFDGTSMGEDVIADILNARDIPFRQEATLQDFVDKDIPVDADIARKRADFAIMDDAGKYIAAIEYDGRQHFHEINTYSQADGLEKQINTDEEKTAFFAKAGIRLLRIRYDQSISDCLNAFLSGMKYEGFNPFLTASEYWSIRDKKSAKKRTKKKDTLKEIEARTAPDGRVFQSRKAMAEAYGVPDKTYSYRVNKGGMTKEEALMTPVSKNGADPVTDTDGTVYASFSDLCRAHGITDKRDIDRAAERIKKQGYSLKKALSEKVYTGVELTVAGITYSNEIECAQACGVSVNSLRNRLNQNGMTADEAVRDIKAMQEKEMITVNGESISYNEASKRYGISSGKLHNRIKKLGWTPEEACGLKPHRRKPTNGSKITAPDGITYPSFTAMCRAYGWKDGFTVWSRYYERHMSLYDALTKPKAG